MSAKKKYLPFAALFCAAMLLLGGCNNADELSDQSVDHSSAVTESSSGAPSGSDVSSTVSDTSSTESSETSGVPDTTGLPRMDGSTSAIPLEIGLRSGFLGISYSAAKAQVKHTTTHDSFKRLIGGEVDLIFSVPISEEQQRAADEAGVKLTMEPVAREGFVFVVNVNNPIDSLTQDQLRRIYSGEITNWKQVGGNDEPILPYQRNIDSGSQNYMTVFMGDTPLAEPKIEFVTGGMSGLMDAVAVYDNSAGAIGYSVYSYAAQMYANANKVKFIAVDGIAPSKATMADESYPLLSCTYIIYTDKSPENAREFAEKALSDEGQTYVLESGYLPVNGMEVPEKYLPYEAVGTGAPRPADYSTPTKYSEIGYLYTRKENSGEEAPIIETDTTFRLAFLKDTELQTRINDDISEVLGRIGKDGISVNCRNGYLSITLTRGVPNKWGVYSKAETLNYDLFTGKKIERFSDLFYEGENFLPELNRRISAELNAQVNNYLSDNEPKQDFSGILGEPRLFTINCIGFEPDNPYFTYGQFTKYFKSGDNLRKFDYCCIATQYSDLKEFIADEWVHEINEGNYDNEWEREFVYEGDYLYFRFIGSEFHTAEEVKAEDEFWYGLQRRRLEILKLSAHEWYADARRFGKKANYYYVGNYTVEAESSYRVNFDADTLEPITIEMLVGKDWQQYLNDSEQNKEFAKAKFYPSHWWVNNDDQTVTIYAYSVERIEGMWGFAHLTVPKDKVNKRYLSDQ